MLSNLGLKAMGIEAFSFVQLWACFVNSKNLYRCFFCKHLGLQAHRFLKLLVSMILRFESHRYGRVLSSFMLIMFHSVSEGFDRLYSEVFPFIVHLSSPDFRLESKVEGLTLTSNPTKSNHVFAAWKPQNLATAKRLTSMRLKPQHLTKKTQIYNLKTPRALQNRKPSSL